MFFEEFRKFIMRGNVIDLAVAVVIGAAFTTIVNSLVADIITPVILNPVMDFLKVKNLENVMWHNIKYGKFLASVINFFIIGFVLFIIVRMMNRIQHKLEHKEKQEALEKEEAIKKEIEEKGPKLSLEESLLTEIRDLLSKSKTK